MIIEQIQCKYDKELEVFIEKTEAEIFHIYFQDTELKIISDLKEFNSEESAKHYAEQLAGLIN